MDLPKKFCDEMKRILGEEYPAYLASMEDTRKYGLRVNTAKISVEDFLKISPFELTPIPYVDNGFTMIRKWHRRNTLIILQGCIIFRIPVP